MAPISAEGVIGTWSTTTSIPKATYFMQSFVAKNRIYLLGGRVPTGMTSEIYSAVINSNGTLGTWTLMGNLPIGYRMGQTLVTTNRVYILAGSTSGIASGVTDVVYTALINENGTLGTWSTANPLATKALGAPIVTTYNRVYLLGGYNGKTGINTIQTAVINPDGTLGTWNIVGALPEVMEQSQFFSTKKRVYIIGGKNASGVTAKVYSAPINIDGTIGTWSVGANLPIGIALGNAVVTSSRVYLIGGMDSGSMTINKTYYTSVTGSLNDYSRYYDGTETPVITDGSGFFIPDYSSQETETEKYYIKY